MENQKPFWESKALAEMTPEEWESLCDRCGKCCLHKFTDEETGDIYYTNVACSMLDTYQCHCTVYTNRMEIVPSCIVLTPKKSLQLNWLPRSCAYRLIGLGEDLEWWHPLLSGDTDTIHKAGISLRGKAISEKDVDIKELESYIVDWII